MGVLWLLLYVWPAAALRVLVVGGTGRTGLLLTRACLADERVRHVTCAVRDLGKGRRLLGADSARLSLVPCDLARDGPERLASVLRVSDADAVVCTASYAPSLPPDPLGPLRVDGLGTRRLIDACADRGVRHFVLLSSLLTNGLAAGQLLNPQFLLLNAAGGILAIKRATELHLQAQSRLSYTIVRPGGLTDEPSTDSLVLSPQDTTFGGSVSRARVADVLLASLHCPDARDKVVEVVALARAPLVPLEEAFRLIPSRRP